ncbi:PKD domain-containing protein [Actinotalea ferrariae]|uniref:PKD domain-containing protein n=1 Tax=Actinotalea ferrariae TaxID=1386098 RepID=UPI001C8CAD96|nr:PKD domain-containing protein [Actinotalea ferrariae]MBX9244030.1 PKD domain-containing protein [Actinotalea ferrariae]
MVDVVCADGAESLDPLYRRDVDPVTGEGVGPWVQVDDGGCPEDVAPTIVLSAEEFRRLPLTASVPSFQPGDGRGLVNMDLIAFTDPAPQVLTTSVLGVPVTVRATPAQFSWDFGDGSAPFVTSDPGRPWPDHTVGHPYARPGSYSVQLTTTWTGEYQVDGAGPWLVVDGTAQTTSPPFPATVEEARARLVAGAQP